VSSSVFSRQTSLLSLEIPPVFLRESASFGKKSRLIHPFRLMPIPPKDLALREWEIMAKKRIPADSPLRRNKLTYLSAEERRKYELARELGLLDLVKEVGWAGLSAKETGRIGGLMGQEKRRSDYDSYERP